MKREEINIRDPFVLVDGGKYYLYGSDGKTCWGMADRFFCYVSSDLEEFDGPIEIFRRPEGFFADRYYWAPECIRYRGAFYLVTTFGAEDRKKGIYILRSESPAGPFALWSEELTPPDWTSIDGTVFVDGEAPYLIFSHSFEDSPDGDMCMLPLSADLKEAAGAPVTLFSAAEAPWAKPVPFAKEEFGMEGKVYFTDGPCVFATPEGGLGMTWSSWGSNGYAVGVAVSRSGSVSGPWEQLPVPLYPENGGHGMLFYDRSGAPRFALHTPNERTMERPVFLPLEFHGGVPRLTEQ